MNKSPQDVSGVLRNVFMPPRKRVVFVTTLILWVFLLLTNPLTSRAKPIPNGFYIVINSVRKCPNRVKSLDGSRQYCLPKEPVISEREIESVGEVQTHPTLGIYYILIRLNLDGYNTIRMVTDKLPGNQVALVVNGKVAGTFEGMDKSIGRTITILGGQNNAEIEWIYQHLKRKL